MCMHVCKVSYRKSVGRAGRQQKFVPKWFSAVDWESYPVRPGGVERLIGAYTDSQKERGTFICVLLDGEIRTVGKTREL